MGRLIAKLAAFEGQVKVHQTKRDTWIVILLWVAVGGMVIAAGNIWASPTPMGFRLAMSTLLLASAGFVLWVLHSTRYIIAGQELVVYCGPFRWRVLLESIEEIYPTRNPLSSPACSLDRLHIRYRESRFGIMISPKDKAAFLQDLVSQSPGLIMVEGRVKRVQSLS